MRIFVFASLLCLFTPSLFAQNGENAEAAFEVEIKKGKTAYETGDYKTAVAAFRKAYDIRPTPSLLYNIARSHDADGSLDEAETFYSRFIEAPGISQKARADAVDRLKTIRDIKRMRADKESSDKTEKENDKTPAEKEDAKKSTSSGAPSPATWVLLGFGAASLGAGLITGIVSQSQYDDLVALGYPDNVPANDLESAKSKRDSGQTLKISSIVLIASGALLTTGGIITYFVTKPNADETAWKFTPVVDSKSAGFQILKSW